MSFSCSLSEELHTGSIRPAQTQLENLTVPRSTDSNKLFHGWFSSVTICKRVLEFCSLSSVLTVELHHQAGLTCDTKFHSRIL